MRKKKIIKYKKCKCPQYYWEVVIYDRDEEFRYRSTIHHHCRLCSIDYVVEDFFTGKKLYVWRKKKKLAHTEHKSVV